MDEHKKKDVEQFVSGLLGEKVEMPFLTNEMVARAERAAENMDKKDRSFDCIACGSRFTPAPGQWIFYDLCDGCFPEFDRQKMRGRLGMLSPDDTVKHFESAEEWVESRKP